MQHFFQNNFRYNHEYANFRICWVKIFESPLKFSHEWYRCNSAMMKYNCNSGHNEPQLDSRTKPHVPSWAVPSRDWATKLLGAPLARTLYLSGLRERASHPVCGERTFPPEYYKLLHCLSCRGRSVCSRRGYAFLYLHHGKLSIPTPWYACQNESATNKLIQTLNVRLWITNWNCSGHRYVNFEKGGG